MTISNSVHVHNVTKVYASGSNQVIALKDVSLTIEEHDFVCIVGPSGCGKTTLLNLVAGFEKPSAGQLEAFGRLIDGPGPDRTMMFQDYALFPWLTVKANIEYGLKRIGVAASKRAQIVRNYITFIELEGFENKYPMQLSGGMRQRVALARALAVNPKILLMDEPFAALDSFTREKMQDELIRVWEKERKAVLFITHNIDEAIKLADVVVVMCARPGRIAESFRINSRRPRDVDSDENTRLVHRVRQLLHAVASDRDNVQAA